MLYQQTRRLTVITVTTMLNHNPIHPCKQAHAASTANSPSTQQHYRVHAALAVRFVFATLLTNSATLSIVW